MSIHDQPLVNYPHLIVTLIRQGAIKIIKKELAAKGIRLHQVTACELQLLAEANELIMVAIDTIRTAADLQSLAEREARQRAKGHAALSPRQIHLKTPTENVGVFLQPNGDLRG